MITTLKGLPAELINFSKLREVRIGRNLFKEVPPVLCQIAVDRLAHRELFSLYLAVNNYFDEVPKEIKHYVRSMPICNSYFSESAPYP